MSFGGEERRILSRPVRVRWMGWASDTYALQQHGWKLAVDYDPAYDRYRLCMTSSHLKLWAVSDWSRIDRRHAFAFAEEYTPEFTVAHVASSIQVRVMDTAMPSFKEIDAQPTFCDSKITCLEDMNIFSAPKTRTEEVLISRADMSVVEHLEAIKALQSEKQKELRKKALTAREYEKFNALPKATMVAQLIEYDEAA